jgi:hypothetical protein
MSKLDEVKAKLQYTADAEWPSADEAAEYRSLSLTLAAEVDALRAKLLDADAYNGALEAAEFSASRLADELARVKAESLRVVVGEAQPWHCCEGVCLYEDGEPMLTFEGQYASYTDRYPQDDELVQPVRLERWEEQHNG